MFCEKCGKKIKFGEAVCGHCGKKQTQLTQMNRWDFSEKDGQAMSGGQQKTASAGGNSSFAVIEELRRKLEKEKQETRNLHMKINQQNKKSKVYRGVVLGGLVVLLICDLVLMGKTFGKDDTQIRSTIQSVVPDMVNTQIREGVQETMENLKEDVKNLKKWKKSADESLKTLNEAEDARKQEEEARRKAEEEAAAVNVEAAEEAGDAAATDESGQDTQTDEETDSEESDETSAEPAPGSQYSEDQEYDSSYDESYDNNDYGDGSENLA